MVQLTINNLAPGNYSAILVLENEPDLFCFPADDGKDSLVQYFEKVDHCNSLFLGKFRGIEPSISIDSIEIEIQFANYNTGIICENPYLSRIINPLGNNDTTFIGGGYGIYYKCFFPGNGSGDLRGEIFVNQETLTAHFSYRLGNVDYTFKGRKIN